MPVAFAHPCLLVPDLEKARRFYQDMFGFELVSERNSQGSEKSGSPADPGDCTCRAYMMKAQNCSLELVESREPFAEPPLMNFRDAQDPGLHHLSFYVDDCWGEYRRFQELGGFAMGIPAGDARHGYSVFCRDPFGNIMELTERPRPETIQSHLPDGTTHN